MRMLVVNHPCGYYHHPLTTDTVAIGIWMHTVPLVDGFDPDRAAEYGVIGESDCSCGIDTPHPIPDGDDDASPSSDPIHRVLRLALSIGGFAQPDVWQKLSITGPELPAKPRHCAECPLRRGGEWSGRVSDLIAINGDVLTCAAKRWWRHKDERRPCAGMLSAVKGRCGDDQS